MKKSIGIIFAAFVLSTAVSIPCFAGEPAGTRLKANALYWAVGVPNLSVETSLGKHWGLNVDAVYSPWQSINGRPYVVFQLIAEGRYYFRESARGFYVGVYAAFDAYKLSKWGHPSYEVQHGVGKAFGGAVGYQFALNRRWGMDCYLGGGWHGGDYYGIDERTGDYYARWNGSGEWIPYKAGVAFTYRLGK